MKGNLKQVADALAPKPANDNAGRDAPRGYWCVVHTNPKAELLTAKALNAERFATYVPMWKKRRTVRGKVVNEPRVLFNRYILVLVHPGCDGAPDWRVMFNTRGVRHVFVVGDRRTMRPAPIKEEFVLELRNKEKDNFGLWAFTVGQTVMVNGGVFGGNIAEFDRWLDESGRVGLLIEALGRKVRIETTASSISAM